MKLKQRFAEINDKISVSIRTYRRDKGISQCDFSKLLGVSQPHLSKIENGLAAITAAQYIVFVDLVEQGEKK